MSAPERMQQQFSRYDWSRAHRAEIQVRYGDMDMMGHLNNAVYMQYLETARLSLWKDRLIGEQGYSADDRTVIAHLELDYGHEIKYGQQVMIETLIERLGGTSWTLVSRFLADGQPCAFARTVQVAVDGQLRPHAIPEKYRSLLSELLVSDA